MIINKNNNTKKKKLFILPQITGFLFNTLKIQLVASFIKWDEMSFQLKSKTTQKCSDIARVPFPSVYN